MSLLPSFVIVFDTTALLAGKTREWQQFSQLGECLVSEGVLEAMNALCDRAPEPAIEATAREFTRFYPTSGWKTSLAIAEHPLLKPADGHTLSQRARLSLEVLKCAYGVARRRRDSLVIVVANDQLMLQKIQGLNTKNLCGIPLAALMQWSRTQRRPAAVAHYLQLTRSPEGAANIATSRQTVSSKPYISQPIGRVATAPTPVLSRSIRKASARRPVHWSRLVANSVNLLIIVTLSAISWWFINPISFNQIWQQIPIVGK
ncbi:PIN domain-containing protein [Leptolyngbyaceae cyanobacterium UHCC 1019]